MYKHPEPKFLGGRAPVLPVIYAHDNAPHKPNIPLLRLREDKTVSASA